MAFILDLGSFTHGSRGPGFQSSNGEEGPRKIDPASTVQGAPPNFGNFAIPHILSFSGTAAAMSNVYRATDEALRDSFENARFMRNDLVIMECVEARQRATALLNWHIEADDEKSPVQKELSGTITKMLQRIPRFMQYRENLLHATFYGRYGVANRWQWKNIGGKMRINVGQWRPVHGDKLVWRHTPDDPRWDEDQVGIRVGMGYSAGKTVAGRWTAEQASQIAPTEQGLCYFLRPWEKPLLSIHKHYIEDGEFETPENAGRVHGVGIRSRIYWTWYQKQETLAWLMEYLERSAGGFEIWYYPWGNDAAKSSVETAAKERMGLGRNQLLVPKFLENDQFGQWYDRVEPGMAGAEALKSIIIEYFGHLLKRYILGQTLTTESSGTGLGSNLADVHLATFLQIVKYDATLLEETITTELIDWIVRYNFPWAAGIPFRFRIDTESENSEEKLKAWKTAYEMGCKIRSQDVMDIIGATKPAPGDEVLDASQNQPMMPGMGMPGMPGAGPPAAEGGHSAAGNLPDGGKVETDSPDGDFETPAGTEKYAAGKLDTPPNVALNNQATAGRPTTERYSALFEQQHPREEGGLFTEKSNAGSKGGSSAKQKRDLPGLPTAKGTKERKLTWDSSGGDADKGLAMAEARGDAQYRSLPGQKGLFAGGDDDPDAEHLKQVHAAHERGAIKPAQVEAAADWVAQHGHYPKWHVHTVRRLFDGQNINLIGRVDRGTQSHAVHIDADGDVSVYPWPGSEGKHKAMRFGGTLTPIADARGNEATAESHLANGQTPEEAHKDIGEAVRWWLKDHRATLLAKVEKGELSHNQAQDLFASSATIANGLADGFLDHYESYNHAAQAVTSMAKRIASIPDTRTRLGIAGDLAEHLGKRHVERIHGASRGAATEPAAEEKQAELPIERPKRPGMLFSRARENYALAWSEEDHPRDDDGRFIGDESIDQPEPTADEIAAHRAHMSFLSGTAVEPSSLEEFVKRLRRKKRAMETSEV